MLLFMSVFEVSTLGNVLISNKFLLLEHLGTLKFKKKVHTYEYPVVFDYQLNKI